MTDFKKIDSFIDTGKRFSFKTFDLTEDYNSEIKYALSVILSRKSYQHLNNTLSFVISELIANAFKANLKRVYFETKGLYINLPHEYEQGTKEFAQALRKDKSTLASELSSLGYYIVTEFYEYSLTDFKVRIVNNCEIAPEEEERIKDKLSLFSQIKGTPDKMFEYLDEKEGAGLGFIFSLKLMQEVGIEESSISYKKLDGNQTSFELNFKYNNVEKPPYNVVAEEIIKELKSIPKLPESVRTILKKLLKDDTALDNIISDIQKDPSLSTEILKLVNSAGVTLSRKIDSIKQAVNMVGIKGVKNILYSTGAMQALSNRFGSMHEIWDASFKVALTSFNIARIYKLSDKNAEDYYTAGLLHNVGKIILLSFNEEKAIKIEKMCLERGVVLPVMQEIMMGISYAAIGAMILKQWEFPQDLVDAVYYHTDPSMALANKSYAYTVCLAKYISELKSPGDAFIGALDIIVRKYFMINLNEDIISIYHKLDAMKNMPI
jgi:HD-like signal output (HDOD) protein